MPSHRSIRWPVAACAMGLISVSVGNAQQAGPPEAPSRIVVTATRHLESQDTVLAPTFVISREELERSLANDIGEVLRFHAGVDVVRSGGPGQPTSVFIRGAESNHTLVLVDGVRINPGTIGSAALQNFVPEHIERIEVVKGPRSTLYGSDAIGGVINIITRQDHTSGSRFAAQAGVGPYSTRQGSALASFAGDAGTAGLNLSWLESKGFPTLAADTTDRGFDNLSFGTHASTTLGAIEVGIRYWQAQGTSEYSDFFRTPIDQDFRNNVAAIDLAATPTDNWRTKFILSRIEDRLLQNQSDDNLRTERYALDWQNDIAIGTAHRLTAGVMHWEETADALVFGTAFDADTDVTSLYLQERFTTGRHELILALGYTDHTTFGSHTTWSAEYGIGFGQNTRVIASAGTAFRAPDATDRFGFGGNPNLNPEESRQFELGLQQRLSDRQLIRLSAFQNDIDDLIDFVVLDFDTFDGELRNVDVARIRGVELTWELAGTDWRVRAEASHQEPENRTSGERLLRRARNSLAIGYVHTFGPLELGLDVLAVGDRKDSGSVEPVTLDAYALANLTARYILSSDWSVLARVENAFDEQYELASGYNTPDRGIFIAVRYAPR